MFIIKCAMRSYAMSIGMFVIPFSYLRIRLLRLCGVKIGEGCWIGFNVICDTNFAELVTIGDNVAISHNTMIITHTMSSVGSYLANIYNKKAPVKIEDGAWIGANCIVLPKVTIGRNCMVGLVL